MPSTSKPARSRAKPNVSANAPTGEGSKTARQKVDMSGGTYRPEDTQDVDLVRETLRAICRDPSAPAAARAQAARTLAEMAGALGRHAPPPATPARPLADMTREELEAELAALSRA